jgi:hypothetical protein
LNNLARENWDLEVMAIEQNDDLPFRRGWLLNVGFDILSREGRIDEVACVSFHDVDMLGTELTRYDWCDVPTQLCTEMEKWDYGVTNERYFGGVTVMNPGDFIAANGYSNSLEGWGGEDDDMFFRICMFAERFENCTARRPPRGQGYCYNIEDEEQERSVVVHESYKRAVYLLHTWQDINASWTEIDVLGDGLTTIAGTYSIRNTSDLLDPRQNYTIKAMKFTVDQNFES